MLLKVFSEQRVNYKARNRTAITLGAAEDLTQSLCAPPPHLH